MASGLLAAWGRNVTGPRRGAEVRLGGMTIAIPGMLTTGFAFVALASDMIFDFSFNHILDSSLGAFTGKFFQ